MSSKKRVQELIYYWSENAIKDKLYLAIRLNDTAEIERLRAEGTTLSDHIKAMLKNGGGSLVNTNEYGMDWYDFGYGLSDYSSEEFISVIRNLYTELGEPIYYSDTVASNVKNFYRTDVFKCVLDCFDNRKISKKWTLRHIIDNNSVELLRIAADHGWFRLAKKCDEYIEYARENGHVECAAWLLDFKGRTFDSAKEREKAEKRQNAMLNASPDSVTALKALWSYKKQEDGTIKIKRYKGDSTKIIVPEKIGKDVVTAIEVDVYYSGFPKKYLASSEVQGSVTTITLPKGLVSIGASVFYEFTELCEINIPEGVLSIGENAFYKCQSLKRLTLPDSVREIGYSAFNSCAQLEEINIPHGVTEIRGSVFMMCEKLRAVEIPDSVQGIWYSAFAQCKSLETITIPSGVTEISESAFSGCKSLTRVELPDTITKIGKYAFTGCAVLKELVLPEGVREIGDVAFASCTALERIVLPASLEKAKNYTQKDIEPRTIFYNSPNVTAVVTPKSYAEGYCKRNNIPFVYKEN